MQDPVRRIGARARVYRNVWKTPALGLLAAGLLIAFAHGPARVAGAAETLPVVETPAGEVGLWPAWCGIVAGRLRGVYPVLAKQILEDTGVHAGLCLDLDAGAAGLSIALARAARGLTVHALNAGPATVSLAERAVRDAGLGSRVVPVTADVGRLPYAAESVDLVVSRGAFRFWPDKAAAFTEIYRVLKPGGTALVGGGFGRAFPVGEGARIWEGLKAERTRIGIAPAWERTKPVPEEITRALRAVGVADFRIVPEADCACRMWIEIRKP